VVGVVVAAVCALLYLLARVTPMFALDSITVGGAKGATAQAVAATLAPYRGKSLLTLDAAGVARELEALPSVRHAWVDRAFPHELRVTVVPEPAVAVLRTGGEAWLVSARGRIIAGPVPGRAPVLPTVTTRAHAGLRAGELVADPSVEPVLAALAALPPRFPARVTSGRVADGRIVLVLAPHVELRIGEPSALPLKLAVAARILELVPAAERPTLGYLDVSAPARPVSAVKPQPVG
jgi:cell division septal protein FtsQ